MSIEQNKRSFLAGAVVIQNLSFLSLGFIVQTLLLAVSLKPFVHSYVRETATYILYFDVGNRIFDFHRAILWSYAIPITVLTFESIWAKRGSSKSFLSRRASIALIIFGTFAQIIFWVIQFWLAFAAHFTTGDIFNSGT